jgi:hypothetical protein
MSDLVFDVGRLLDAWTMPATWRLTPEPVEPARSTRLLDAAFNAPERRHQQDEILRRNSWSD